MSVPTDAVTERVLAGAGSASPLDIDFNFLDGDDLIVTAIVAGVENDEPLERGVDYTVAGGNGSTGTVTPAEAIPVGTSWRVRRETPIGQPATLPSDSYQPKQIEAALDRQALALQEQAREIGRAVMVQRGESAPVLRPATELEGKVLGLLAGEVVPVADIDAFGQFGEAVADAVQQVQDERAAAVAAIGTAGDDEIAAIIAAASLIGPTAQAFIVEGGIVAGATYVVDRSVLNGQTFARFHARVTGGTGSVELAVLVNGLLVHGPVSVGTAGRTDTVSISAPLNADIEFSVVSVTGTPTVVFIKMVGLPA